MLTNTYEPLVIFSLKDEHRLEWAKRMIELSRLRGFEGSYKGVREPSFALNAHDFHVRDMARVLEEDGQESVLFLDNQRNAFLRFGPEFSERGQKYLGVWRHVPRDVALARDAWTRDPQSDLYYVAG